MGLRVQGLGYRVEGIARDERGRGVHVSLHRHVPEPARLPLVLGLGFGDLVCGLWVLGLGLWGLGCGLGVGGLGFKIWGLGFRV